MTFGRVGRPFEVPDPAEAKPEPKAQRNFTDPDSRIMLDGATKSFVQAYNVQIAVDAGCQIVVASEITQEAVDSRQLLPMLAQVRENLGAKPVAASADAGYFSEANLTSSVVDGIAMHVPPNQREASDAAAGGAGRPKSEVAQAMRAKLASPAGKAIYRMRKALPEPVFGQIKAARNIRSFLLRGFAKARAEWRLICATHNLLKLFRHHHGRFRPV